MARHHEQPTCTMCDRVGTLLCSGCKSIHYCSTACQRIDWPVHKIICKDYAQFVSARPDANHHSAIYFNPDEPQPRFVWLPFECGHNHPSLEYLEQFGVSADRIKARSFQELPNNPMLNRHIEPHHILLSLPEAANLCPCCNKDSKPNDSLTKVDEELANFFRGRVLALGTHCEADIKKKPSDLNLSPIDFRHVVDNLRIIYCYCKDDT